MNDVTANELSRIPEGMKWCPHCSGYGSSFREAGERCSHCGGSGLVWAEHEQPVASGDGEAVPPQ